MTMLVTTLSGCSEILDEIITEESTSQENKTQETNEFAGDGTWTILVYLCGTDLESYQGSGTLDLQEMIGAQTDEKVKFVVQTGGCSQWQNDVVAADKIQRYEITNQEMIELSSKKQANMGKSKTLKDFVNWGMKQYGDSKLGLILWDHGGGSISGVCMDENYNGDTLTLKEIDKALEGIERKFNFIGYDACLMSTLENAAMLSKYASYMIASEELESGNGWDYTAIGNALYENPTMSTPDLGKVICDSFMASCMEIGEQDTTTLAVTDLSKIKGVIRSFHQVAGEMTECISDENALGKISKGIRKAQNYGGNTPSEGYTNMVDLGDVAKKISSQVDTQALTDSLAEANVYQVKGKKCAKASGLSVYYPLEIQSKNELSVFEEVCVSDNYLNFIGAMVYGATTGSTQGYAGENDWSEVEEDTSEFATDEQAQISLSQELYLNDDNYYAFTIDESSLPNVLSVQYNLYMYLGEDYPLCYLGSDNDLDYDETTGEVVDNFQGYWPCLPDGSLLTMYVVEEAEDYSVYSAPIYLNGEATNLRFMYTYGEEIEDGYWTVLGAWDGLDEFGQAAKELQPIKSGDKIVPIYISVDAQTGETEEIKGDTYKVQKDFNIQEMTLCKGEYFYNFSVMDLYGSSLYLDILEFYVNENGEVELM